MIDRIDQLFEQVFALRAGRRPQHWEAALGKALVSGHLAVNRPPQAPELLLIHQVAEAVSLALRKHQKAARLFAAGRNFVVEEQDEALVVNADGPVFIHWFEDRYGFEVRPARRDCGGE